MAKELDTPNPYEQDFRVDWKEGRDPSLEWIWAQVGSGPCRMTLGGVTGLYLVAEVSPDHVVVGTRKPD